MSDDLREHYFSVKASHIVGTYLKDLKAGKRGERIADFGKEWWYDPHKGEFVIRVLIEKIPPKQGVEK